MIEMIPPQESSEAGARLAGGLSCPLPLGEHREIVLGHGSGGKLTHQLIDQLLLPQLGNELLNPLHDGAVLQINGENVAFSTDSFVVNPIFFPGGDIGRLAVHGTVNDLAMCGAKPLYLSLAFILEEGLPIADLMRVIESIKQAAEEAGVLLVTGDTKVVDRGKADSIFINTAGVGLIRDRVRIHPRRAQPGDKILVSGEIAAHGMAIMSVRDGLEFETEILSDTAALHGLVDVILRSCPDVHVLRDPTRGGLTSVLNEIALQADVGILIEEEAIPIHEQVRAACEILGLDPLHVANEGKLIAVVSREDAERVLSAMRSHSLGERACIIGEVTATHRGLVTMKTRIGGARVVDMLSGDQLPRIC